MSHANPTRGAKSVHSFSHNPPTGLSGASITFPVPACCSTFVPEPRYKLESSFGFLLAWGPKYSQRRPRLSVRRRVVFQLSWTYKADSWYRLLRVKSGKPTGRDTVQSAVTRPST